MENQAFGRVHRIGQLKETYFVKIVVKDSVDERLLAMQHDKEQLISKALQEDAKHKTAPTLEELMKLFGEDVETNEAGEVDVAAPADEDDVDGNVEAVDAASVEEAQISAQGTRRLLGEFSPLGRPVELSNMGGDLQSLASADLSMTTQIHSS